MKGNIATNTSKMTTNYKQSFGKKGENLAMQWLEQAGFTLLQQNWRTGSYEIDVIASRGAILHFIEVKTRKNHAYGYPEQAVDRKKLLHIMYAATVYLKKHPLWKRVQYDILAITIPEGGLPSYYFLEDVYL